MFHYLLTTSGGLSIEPNLSEFSAAFDRLTNDLMDSVAATEGLTDMFDDNGVGTVIAPSLLQYTEADLTAVVNQINRVKTAIASSFQYSVSAVQTFAGYKHIMDLEVSSHIETLRAAVMDLDAWRTLLSQYTHVLVEIDHHMPNELSIGLLQVIYYDNNMMLG